ncbi:MAG: hypothetical protein AAFY55_17780 [Bacteroidota bacterium]
MQIPEIDIHPLSMQEVLDRVWDHFVTRGQPLSYYQAPLFNYQQEPCGCLYRHPEQDGVCCAIGLFLTDEMYDPGFEGDDIETVARDNYEIGALFERCAKPFLMDLQDWHDKLVSYDTPARREATLFVLANTWGLAVPVEQFGA